MARAKGSYYIIYQNGANNSQQILPANRLYASGITEANISLTTFADLKYVICFSW